MSAPLRTILVISDATGETAEKVVRAALRQFNVGVTSIDLRFYSHLRNTEQLDAVVAEAAEAKGLMVFTIVSADLREALGRRCEAVGVPSVDLIGTLMGTLAGFLSLQPRGVPGLLHTVSNEYYRRMEAIEFTVKNDDGRDPANLPKADLILVGISRTSKTPLSTFIAQKGFKVANVPLVLDIPPPLELLQAFKEINGSVSRLGELEARILANLTGVPIDNVMDGSSDDEVTRRMALLAPRLGTFRHKFMPAKVTTCADIFAWVKEIEAEEGRPIDLLEVDYVDKMGASASALGKQDNTYQVQGDNAEELRLYVHGRGIYGWSASQAQRRSTKDRGKRLELDDLADSQNKARVVDLIVTATAPTEGEVALYVAGSRFSKGQFEVGPYLHDFASARVVQPQEDTL